LIARKGVCTSFEKAQQATAQHRYLPGIIQPFMMPVIGVHYMIMAIQLKPELEALIRQDVLRGPYQSVDEFVERAVSQLHEQETWLAAHRDEIRCDIEEGWQAAERNELSSEQEVQARMEARKKEWLEQRFA
jgi:Arc/MetJ-type ribon-helix-helix transcriptional regulator